MLFVCISRRHSTATKITLRESLKPRLGLATRHEHESCANFTFWGIPGELFTATGAVHLVRTAKDSLGEGQKRGK
jgi:hypothetical protein